jgi:Flp pilus assembly protein TadB
MKALFLLLVISISAVLVAMTAMWWRLRRHLRHSDHLSDQALDVALQQIEPQHEPVQQG